MHVVDISHPNFEEQYEVVEKTINELLEREQTTPAAQPWKDGPKSAQKKKVVKDVQRIVVFNKIDAFSYTPKEEDDLTPVKRENISLEDFEKTWMAKLGDDCIFISARQKVNMDALRQKLYRRVKEIHVQRYPYNDFLFQTYE